MREIFTFFLILIFSCLIAYDFGKKQSDFNLLWPNVNDDSVYDDFLGSIKKAETKHRLGLILISDDKIFMLSRLNPDFKFIIGVFNTKDKRIEFNSFRDFLNCSPKQI